MTTHTYPNNERPINFFRDRYMLCHQCGHIFTANLEILEALELVEESCPACGITCKDEESPRVTADPYDPILDPENVNRFTWYHTSTIPDWPQAKFDPTFDKPDWFIENLRNTLGGESFNQFIEDAKSVALHVGTYESAIHNMLRRIDEQDSFGKPFYLYRVTLRDDAVTAEKCDAEFNGIFGDVKLSDACPEGIDTARYVNSREDPGSISLALRRSAIAAIQRIEVPLPKINCTVWQESAIVAVQSATYKEPVREPGNPFWDLIRARDPKTPEDKMRSAKVDEARKIGTELSTHVPCNMRRHFISALRLEGRTANEWALYAAGILELIGNSENVLSVLNDQQLRPVLP